MASLIGDALIWLLGQEDLLWLLGSFTLGVGILHTLFAIRDYYEGG